MVNNFSQFEVMKFSIVVPVFNGAEYIENALNSVLPLESEAISLEVIVVDDCSVDDTVAVVKNFACQNNGITLLELSQNSGPGVARNQGMKRATGDWVLFLDSDDTFDKDVFNAINACILQNPQTDLVCFNWQYDRQSSSQIHGYEGRDDLALLANNTKQDILRAYLLNQIDCSVIYSAFRRDFIDQSKLSFRQGIHEDVDFMFISLAACRYISVIDQALYFKNNSVGSIVNTFSADHIRGYVGALAAMYRYLEDQRIAAEYREDFISSTVNVVASRIVRVFRYQQGQSDIAALLIALFDSVQDVFQSISYSPRTHQSEGFRTKYQQIFDYFWQQMSSAKTDRFEQIQLFTKDISAKTWSCYDLHNAVFLAPDEIRTCCKRYFYQGKMKGDVVLINSDAHDAERPLDYQAIVDEKIQLHKEINRNNAPQCEGCPFLQFADWGQPLSQGVSYLSLEYHSVCNMKCSYCSETYYGGKSAGYDIEQLIDSMVQRNALDAAEYIVWGGGEPLLDKSFDQLLMQINEKAGAVKQRVITNATRVSDALVGLMKQDRAYIVTSVDAGSEETFEQVRHYNRMHKVLKNLQSYAQASPQNVIIKYILLPENHDLSELQAFMALLRQYQLQHCNFQISCDFKQAEVDEEEFLAIATLYGLLLKEHVRFVFLDDLVMQRIHVLDTSQRDAVQSGLSARGLDDVFISAKSDRPIAVWGTGAQAGLLLDKSEYLKSAHIEYFVDPRSSRIGQQFHGKPVYAPDVLKDSEQSIVIAAVQSAPHIYSQYLQLGLPSSRVIQQLIL